MNAFGIAAILGGRHRFKKMLKTAAEDRRKRVVESDRRLEVKLSGLSRGGGQVGRKIKSPRGLAADRGFYGPVFGQLQRELPDGGSAAALELQLDLVHRRRPIARLQRATVERDIHRAGRQIDDALMAAYVRNKNRL